MEFHSRDETEDFYFRPGVVAEPVSTTEVSALIRMAFEHEVPVTAGGARTGLSGGALAIQGGLVLSLRRMNKILLIDEKNHQVIVEPGVITEVLQNTVSEKGLFYAVDPASQGTCTIGGNIAENSGGPRAVKYGVTKDWVLNLEVVLPDGRVIETGANTLKNSTGYNLTGLIVGSEGTLGVVTRATLKLLPLPRFQALMLVPFTSVTNACKTVSDIFRSGAMPSAVEFMEHDAMVLTQEFTGNKDISVNPNDQAYLLIEVDGFYEAEIMPQCERILSVLEENGSGEVLFAQSDSEKEKLWYLRRRVGEAVKASSIYKEEDTVVPRGMLPDLMVAVKSIGEKYGFRSICYGHAGDGNLHINILRDDLSDQVWSEELNKAIRELFDVVVAMGGTLSGEHGIGLVQKDFMDIAFSPDELSVLKMIKNGFDPKGIMNPGKMFPNS
ncbi:MAG: FAD-linked oxidase C-terminal domain-containing protein [Flavobacteriales bacterium]|nr:FAD-linked oxidase C-terminal domain-containing protein [Flavobacteriales bacterium]